MEPASQPVETSPHPRGVSRKLAAGDHTPCRGSLLNFASREHLKLTTAAAELISLTPHGTCPFHSAATLVTPPVEAGSLRANVLRLLAIAWLALFTLYFFAQNVGGSVSRVNLLLILPELLAANVQPAADSGWRYLPQRLDLLATAGLILAAAWGLGRGARGFDRDCITGGHGRGAALRLGMGLSAWSLLTLGLGVIGVVSRPLFVILAGSAMFAGVWRLRQTASSATVGSTSPPVAGSQYTRWFGNSILIACSPFVLAMLLASLLPTTDFDVKEYHLQGPKEYWLAGRVKFLPHNVYTSFPFLTEMLSLSAMALRGEWYRGALAGQAVLMSYAVVTALAVFALARRLAGDAAAWLAVLVLLTTPWVYRISIIAYTEGALAGYLVLTTLALVIEVQTTGTPSRRGVLLIGLLAGSAAACKYPGVLSAVIPFGLALVWLAWRRAESTSPRWKAAGLTAGLYSAGVLLAFGPWLMKNLVETGNPVYPLLWSLFGGESFDAATNIRWKAAHAAPAHLWQQPAALVADVWQRLVDIAVRSDWQSPLLCGLAPLSLACWRRLRGLRWLWLYVVWLLLTWCWVTHRIDRFWVPMIPLLAVLAGVGLAWLLGLSWDRFPTCVESELRRPRGNVAAMTGQVGNLSYGRVVPVFVAGFVGVCVLFNLGFITTGLAGFSGYLLDEQAAGKLPEVEGGASPCAATRG